MKTKQERALHPARRRKKGKPKLTAFNCARASASHVMAKAQHAATAACGEGLAVFGGAGRYLSTTALQRKLRQPMEAHGSVSHRADPQNACFSMGFPSLQRNPPAKKKEQREFGPHTALTVEWQGPIPRSFLQKPSGTPCASGVSLSIKACSLTSVSYVFSVRVCRTSSKCLNRFRVCLPHCAPKMSENGMLIRLKFDLG